MKCQPVWNAWVSLPWAFVPCGPDSLEARFYRNPHLFGTFWESKEWKQEELVVVMKGLAGIASGPIKHQKERFAKETICWIQPSLDDAYKSTAPLAAAALHFSVFMADQTLPVQYQSPGTLWYNQVVSHVLDYNWLPILRSFYLTATLNIILDHSVEVLHVPIFTGKEISSLIPMANPPWVNFSGLTVTTLSFQSC